MNYGLIETQSGYTWSIFWQPAYTNGSVWTPDAEFIVFCSALSGEAVSTKVNR